MSAPELVEFVAKSLVDDPSAVTVEVHEDGDTQVIELHVAEEDMGKVIGRNGSVAKALRTILKVVSTREGQPISLEIVTLVADQPTERVVVGLVRGIHGLRGAVRVEVLTDDATRFAVGAVVHPEGEPDVLTVAWAQEDGPGLLVRFGEVAERAGAESLRDRYLEVEVPRDALPSGEFYWHQVMGATVTTSDGRVLGTVEDVFRAGGSEVFVVSGGAWGEVMVPAVRAVVLEFAPATGRIVVDADGLGLDEEPPVRRPRGRRTTKAARAGTLATPAPGDAPAADAASPEADGPEPA